jgi:two-component system alkaline phosphatase synthesis response regulator PhoP
MNSKVILLVEDEEHLQKTIQLNLELDGYKVLVASNGINGLKLARTHTIDLILLDVMLPEMSGFDVCEEIRKENINTAILFLTAKGSSEDRVRGLKLGADDYLTKPFNLEELLLRVQLLIKRTASVNYSYEMQSFSFEENTIDFISFEIHCANGNVAQLTKREMELLRLLISRKGEVVSREEILDIVWGKEVFPTTRTIDNYILSFRKYFEKNQREPKHFHSVRGVGYKFTV